MTLYTKIYIIAILFLLVFAACSDEKINMVDIKQIEIDGSTNDRYTFKEEILKEKLKESRYKKDNFWK